MSFTQRRVGGVDCFGSPPMGGFSPRVLGFGVFRPPTSADLDAILAHYRALGQQTQIVVTEGAAHPRTVPLLERHGFTRERWTGAGNVLEVGSASTLSRKAAHALVAEGASIDRLPRSEVAAFEPLMRRGFEMRGRWTMMAEATMRALAAHPRSMTGFRARMGGRPAGSGAMLIRGDSALLFSGSVLPRFRGHGLQPALIAARLLHGLDRGVRRFFVQTAQDGSSADNVRDLGFRARWTFTFWLRD